MSGLSIRHNTFVYHHAIHISAVVRERSYRNSLCTLLDGFDAHPSHYPQTPTHRAAALTRATMLFRQKLKLGQLPVEGTKDTPFCMDTFRWTERVVSIKCRRLIVLLDGCSIAVASLALRALIGVLRTLPPALKVWRTLISSFSVVVEYGNCVPLRMAAS